MLNPNPTREPSCEDPLQLTVHPDRPVVGQCLEAADLECIRDDRALFSELSFSLQSGQVLQVEGRNGSGKTTLLRIICGIRVADQGQLLWCGEKIGELGSNYFGQVAYVGHATGVKKELTPLENLRIAQVLGGSVGNMALEDALERVGLYGFEDVPVRALSAGQTRRVALARLLVTHAPLWILDEPFTSLDRSGIATLEELMEAHTTAGGMVVLTTHHRINLDTDRVQYLNLSE